MDAFDETAYEIPGAEPEALAGHEADDGSTPDVGEAIQQLNQRFDEMSQRLPGAEEGYEEEDGGGWDSEFDYNPAIPDGQENGEGTEQLQQLLSEAVREEVGPYIAHQEQMNREHQLIQLADQYPRLREPEVLDAVGAEAERMAQAYGNPGMATDPRLIQQLYLAHEAQTMAEGVDSEQVEGATIEKGAGPGEPQGEQVDPETAAYMAAAAPRRPTWE